MPRETGKQRASGIPLDYFRHRNPLDRGKLLLAGAAAVVTAVWLVGGSLIGRPAEAWYSPGPVTAAHASFEADCLQCHISFTPIVGDAALAIDPKAIDEKCQQCHKVRNSVDEVGHHAVQGSALLACSSCHHEHRGSAASLVATANASCTSCHAQIAAHRAGESTLAPPVADVSRFDAKQHPDFRSIKKDPRHFKFSMEAHRLHMTAGLTLDDKHVPIMRVKDLTSREAKNRYAPGLGASQPVPALKCAACHESRASESGAERVAGLPSSAGGSRSSGAYMMPIVYENHCQACHNHELTIEPDEKGSDLDADHSQDVVRHRLQGAPLAAEVTKFWEDRFLHTKQSQLERPLPLPSHAQEWEDQTGQQLIDSNVTESLQHLRKKCLECHELLDDDAAKTGSDGARLKNALAPQVRAVQIPQVWLEHAKFDHAAHRTVDCSKCHVGADPAAPIPTNAKVSVPMIPGLSTCVECHSPLQESAEPPHGGARTDCVECHRFHNRDPNQIAPLSTKP